MVAAARSAGAFQGTWPLLGGMTIVGLALRIPMMGDSPFGDELSTNFVVNGFGVDSVLGLVGSDQETTPPLFFALTWLVKGLGDPAAGLRWISLLAGLAAIPLTYVLGARTVGTTAGLAGAAVMALSPFMIFYSTEARAYALVTLFVLLAAVVLLKALEKGGWPWWGAYAACVAAAAYTHYTAVFTLLALFAWAALAHPESRRELLLATAGAALLYLPWLGEFLEDGGEPTSQIIEVLHPLTWKAAQSDLIHWSVGHPQDAASAVPGDLGLWLIGAGAALGAVGVGLSLRGGGLPTRPSAGLALVLALAVAAPLGATLHNFVGDSVFVPRNLAASTPGLALAIGALVTGGEARLRIVATALLLAGFAIGAVKMLDEDHQRPDYAGAAEFIEAEGDLSSPVVEIPAPTPGPQTSMEFELADSGEPTPSGRSVFPIGQPSMATRLGARGSGDPGILDPLPTSSPEQVAAAAARQAGDGRLFVVAPGMADEAALRAPTSPAAAFMEALPPRFRDTEVRAFPGFSVFPIYVHVFEGSGGQAG